MATARTTEIDRCLHQAGSRTASNAGLRRGQRCAGIRRLWSALCSSPMSRRGAKEPRLCRPEAAPCTRPEIFRGRCSPPSDPACSAGTARVLATTQAQIPSKPAGSSAGRCAVPASNKPRACAHPTRRAARRPGWG